MKSTPRRRNSERGASAVEYALLISGIAGLIVIVVFAFGPVVRGNYNDTCDQFAAQRGAADCPDRELRAWAKTRKTAVAAQLKPAPSAPSSPKPATKPRAQETPRR